MERAKTLGGGRARVFSLQLSLLRLTKKVDSKTETIYKSLWRKKWQKKINAPIGTNTF